MTLGQLLALSLILGLMIFTLVYVTNRTTKNTTDITKVKTGFKRIGNNVNHFMSTTHDEPQMIINNTDSCKKEILNELKKYKKR